MKNYTTIQDIQNLPLNSINIYKDILTRAKIIRCNPLNYDFIKQKEINDIKKIPECTIRLNEESDDDSNSSYKEYEDILSKKDDEDKKKESVKSPIIVEDKLEEFNKLINKDFIGYKKVYNNINKNLWWPSKVTYAGKKFYVMTKKKDLCNKNKNDIILYCTNHRINTINKKLNFKNNPCNAKMTFKRNENNFYMNREHNNICNNKNPVIYDNQANVTKNVYAFSDYKNDLIINIFLKKNLFMKIKNIF